MTAGLRNDPAKASTQPGRKEYGDWKQESGRWLGLLRDQWFPINPYKFHWTVRFLFLFLGASFYLSALIYIVFTPNIGLIVPVLTIDLLFLSILAPSMLLGGLSAGLLCWIDRDAGPARLFLSGLAFPAFVVLIIRLSLGSGILGLAFEIPQSGAVQ